VRAFIKEGNYETNQNAVTSLPHVCSDRTPAANDERTASLRARPSGYAAFN